MHLEKHVIKSLPDTITNEQNRQYGEYVELVFSGVSKFDAFKEVFPDRYQLAIDRASGNNRVVNANIKKGINAIERSDVVKQAYQLAHKTWWTKFVTKKQDLLENMYDIAMDRDQATRDRVNATKVALQYMPQAATDVNINIDASEKAVTFLDKLQKQKNLLYKVANEDVVDVEVEDIE